MSSVLRLAMVMREPVVEQEVCRVPPQVAGVGLRPVLGVASPRHLLILRRRVRPHLAVRRAVVLVRREGLPAEAAGQGIIGLPIFRTRPVG